MEAEERQRQFTKDVKDIFNTGPGKEVLMYLIDRYQVFDPSSLNATDMSPQAMGFKEGTRHVILEIMRVMNQNVIEQRQEFANYRNSLRRG